MNSTILLQILLLVSNLIAYSMMNSLSAYFLGHVISQVCASKTSPACNVKLSTVLDWTKISVKIALKVSSKDTVIVR